MHAETIGTDRLTLVPLAVEHVEEMSRVLSDPELHAFIGGAPASVEDLRARYERLVAGSPDPRVSWLNWVVRLRETGRLAGTVQATVTDHAGQALRAEVAWVVGKPWQGQGIASEAARALVAWLESRGVRTVLAHVHPDHEASAAVAASAGLSRTEVVHDGEVRWERSTT
jgi:RimJ/RimL family protein N-acetyltransferase